MITLSSFFSSTAARTAAMLAVLLAAACAPQRLEPQQTESTNPSVTYTYRGAEELLQANQSAMTYCERYRSVAQSANVTNNADGSKTAVFECIAMTPTTSPSQSFYPNLAYSYRTDQDLLNMSRNAQIHCMSNGSQRAVLSAATDLNGNKTATFQCVA